MQSDVGKDAIVQGLELPLHPHVPPQAVKVLLAVAVAVITTSVASPSECSPDAGLVTPDPFPI